MRKVLVTGATGFIGRHCLPLLLARGDRVHAVSSKTVPKTSDNICWHQADLLDTAQIAELIGSIQPSHLLHFAWFAVPKQYWTSLDNFRWVQGSLSLLQSFAQHGGERVVMAGTCAEYDWQYGYCSEQITPLLPATTYGICKHSLQSMLNAFASTTGISAAWGRIFFVYGPYEPPGRLVPAVVRSLLQNQPARCSHGKQIRDFLYVRDLADAFVALLDSSVAGSVNMASGNPVTLKDIIENVAAQLERPDLIRLGAIPPAANDPPLLVADVSRLTYEVGWQPRFSLDAGLAETISWWKKSGERSQ